MLPASPYYPTPQSPAQTNTPQPPNSDKMHSEGGNPSDRVQPGGTLAAASDASSQIEHKSLLDDGLIVTRVNPSTSSVGSPLALKPNTPTSEAPDAALPLAKADPEMDLESSFFPPSSRPASPSLLISTATPSAPTEEDRKPSLPPPFPYASTSAHVADIDASRVASPAGSRSASGSRSGASTPKVKPEEEDEDEEDKPVVLSRLKKGGKGKGKAVKVESEPQFIGDLPSGEEEAAATYVELSECTYASKKLGDMAYYDEDASRCDCNYNREADPEDTACGEHSNCMNRLMQIECVKNDCKSGRHCQNCRFQKKQYGKIDIVKTEKKGFGVRAAEDMAADTFIYEYIGEVIGPAIFGRKMKEYANEGIKHFYFMALDKDVFIDATKKGGKGRFLNHSCNPNCVVAKWTVGRKMRMGIFTKRSIEKDEELTFNYNVDRYGHVAQECFCGEPNCVGYIGGKTQTDLGGMDDLYIDALGITEEVEALGLKGSKKRKGKKLDEDFTPTLYPIHLDEVPKVSSAMRQAIQTRRILEKLLTRVHMTTDEEVQRNLLRLHGLNLMHNILREYPTDVEVIILDLEILSRWRLQTRNKIESSNIEESVVKCVEVEDDRVKALASEILASWGELKLGYRIPKAELKDEDGERKRPADFSLEQIQKRARLDDSRASSTEDSSRPVFVRPTANRIESGPPRIRKLPDGWEVRYNVLENRDYYVNLRTGQQQWDVPRSDAKAVDTPPPSRVQQPLFSATELIAQAEAIEKEKRDAEERKKAEEKAERERERAERHKARKDEKEEKERKGKEKRVMGLFSNVVVQTMSKYKSQFEGDAFKKRAKEVCEILVNKEQKRPSYSTDAYDSLSPDKEAKVKAFVKDWVKKLLERKKHGSSTPSGAAWAGSSASTPSRAGGRVESASATPVAMDVDARPSYGNGSGNGNGNGIGNGVHESESPGTPPKPQQ